MIGGEAEGGGRFKRSPCISGHDDWENYGPLLRWVSSTKMRESVFAMLRLGFPNIQMPTVQLKVGQKLLCLPHVGFSPPRKMGFRFRIDVQG